MEGSTRVGRMMGPLRSGNEPGEEPFSMEKFSQQLDEKIPTDSNVVGEFARRTLNIGAPAVVNPFAEPQTALAQSAAAGSLGQVVKGLGGGTLAQTAAEVVPFFFGNKAGKIPQKSTAGREALSESRFIPERIRKTMAKSAANQNEINELVDFAQKNGMTAEEITPLIQGETRKSFFSRFSQRGGDVQDQLGRSSDAISAIADNFKTGEFANVALKPQQSTKMMQKIQDILWDMPAKTRNAILEDANQLAGSPKTTKSIIKFFRDINAQYGEHKKQLGRLKEPLMDALASIDPKLANDFNMTNKLFQKYYDISSKLKPNLVTQAMEHTAPFRFAFGVATGNFPIITEVVGEAVAMKFGKEMLTNPKMQDISRKLVNALNKGQFTVADIIKDEYIRLLKDDYPEVTAEMQKETFKNLFGDE